MPRPWPTLQPLDQNTQHPHIRLQRCLARTMFIALVVFVQSTCVAQTETPGPAAKAAPDANKVVHQFEQQTLTSIYYSEGTSVGDINADGVKDIVYGPYWFAGPTFHAAQEIYPARPQPMHGYTDHFFSWIEDFNNDGFGDVLTVGFPGTPAYVYENPGKSGKKNWTQHQVADWVSNESPAFIDLTGDSKNELVFTRDGVFGYATPQPSTFDAWTFHPISDSLATKTFGHGLGVGDVNGDQRNDVLTKDGWFEQPKDLSLETRWIFHPFSFAGPGGAEMYAYDVDGDGDNDVITSLHAHEYGLAWWEQVAPKDGEPNFKQHMIMGSSPSQNPYGVFFSELHSVALADIDGDGLKDIVTGKTYWSHHRQSHNWDAGAVVYWFKLTRTPDGVQYVPHLADDSSGIGRQIVVTDVDGNGTPDIVTGGMLGCHLLNHTVKPATAQQYVEAQPNARRELTEDLTGLVAAETMTVPEGFSVQLAAAEPDVHQPVAMAFDHRGRLWIAEAYTYPIRAKEGEGLDKIVILEDTNHDGTLDSRKVFAEGLNLVSGLEVGMGGVWVGAAPYLMFIPDADGDDVPDGQPEILLDGFGFQDTHETLNTFNWGPDGWLYGCQGVFTHGRIGKPGTPDAQRIPVNAAVWRYHPTQHKFEIFAAGTSNPWGVDFNDYGQAFATACVIPHLYHIIPGARYQRQAGQHFNQHTYDDIKTIADHLHYAGNIQDHAWWGNEPPIQNDTSDAGGGHAHCGAMVYLGDNWPKRYRNTVFMHNIHGNRVNSDRLARNGSGYVGRHGEDLLLSNDRWFRGINLRYGPDGSVYLIDWYDKNACHRTNPEIWDRTNGRVYNISYGQVERKSVDLSQLDDAQLAKLAWHPNDWHVRMSRKLLQQRSFEGKMEKEVVATEVKKLLASDDDTRVLRGMWLAYVTDLLTENQLLDLSQHASAYVQAWSIQIAAADNSVSPEFLAQMVQLSQDAKVDPIVRLYLASSLQRLPTEQRWDVLNGLASHEADAKDHNLPLMIWYAAEPLVVVDPTKAIQFANQSKIPLLRQYVVRRAASEPKSLNQLLASAASLDANAQAMVLTQVQKSLEGQVNVAMPNAWAKAFEVFSAADNDSVRQSAMRLAVVFGDQRIFPQLRETLASPQASLEDRKQALEILLAGRDPQATSALIAAISAPELQSPAIRGLAAYASPKIPVALLKNYAKLTATAKADAISTLVSRPTYVSPLLDAIEKAEIPSSDLHAYHVRQIQTFGDDQLTARLGKVWGMIGSSSSDQQQAIAKFKKSLSQEVLASADRSHGRTLFQKNCASCHQLFGAGEKVGPDLTGSNRANLDYILENILAPSTVVGKDYQMTLLQLVDGRVASGLIAMETDSAVTLRTINDLVVIAKDDVEERKLSELSLMPAGLIDNFSGDDVRDLIAYLGSPSQVEMRGIKPPFDSKTGKVPGALEGESLKVIQKSSGKVASQNMKEFSADKWSGDDHLWWTGGKPGDKLSLEIEVQQPGEYEILVNLTKAVDYGIVQLYWDEQLLGDPIDCFSANAVITTGMISTGKVAATKGKHSLTLQIKGANPKAIQGYMVALDFVLLNPVPQASAKQQP